MVLGAFGSEVTVVPYVAWESAMTVCYFLWSFFLPTKFRQRVYNYCLMQRRLFPIIPFLPLTSIYQAFRPYIMAVQFTFSNVAPSSRQAVYTKARCLTLRCGTIRRLFGVLLVGAGRIL
ncbi:hypothetical protein EV421DRAFT_135747 [Armillaria borealis]|uniref:Uncharacterized protein n=1 Tax=Armillaria borealis TaxID=47425 RepID=A0AA39IWM2_9AGAR|nr:hypothetical protein EV421DRAFT_135747 [Armillaria borealis]